MIIVLYIILSFICLLVIGNIFTYPLQWYFIFRPKVLRDAYEYKFEVPFTEHYLNTEKQGLINLLWFKKIMQNRPVILYFHGNSSNLSSWGGLGSYFDELGYDLIIYDFRGFGKSKGRRNEKLFHADAKAVYEFACERYQPDQIVIFGRSMGTGIATKLASETPCELLILETPYNSISGLFHSYYKVLPVQLFVFKYEFANNKWLHHVKARTVIFQGTKDRVVPYSCAVKLKPLLKSQDDFITIKGGRHKDLSNYQLYKSKLEEVLGKRIN